MLPHLQGSVGPGSVLLRPVVGVLGAAWFRRSFFMDNRQNLWVQSGAVSGSGVRLLRHGRANEWGDAEKEEAPAVEAVGACGSFARPGLAIPCRVARQQSPTPFCQTGISITERGAENKCIL